MSKRIFSSEEQQQLKNNPNVERCSTKSITYTTAFKKRAVALYERGTTATDIFKESGFNLDLIGRRQPKNCLQRWRTRVKEVGVSGLKDTRGENAKGKKSQVRNTETDRMKWLEAEVKYLRAENDFLARLRAKRAE